MMSDNRQFMLFNSHKEKHLEVYKVVHEEHAEDKQQLRLMLHSVVYRVGENPTQDKNERRFAFTRPCIDNDGNVYQLLAKRDEESLKEIDDSVLEKEFRGIDLDQIRDDFNNFRDVFNSKVRRLKKDANVFMLFKNHELMDNINKKFKLIQNHLSDEPKKTGAGLFGFTVIHSRNDEQQAVNFPLLFIVKRS